VLTVQRSSLSNEPLKLSAAGFSRADGGGRNSPYWEHARPQLSGHPFVGWH
jgi:hypothetical protein